MKKREHLVIPIFIPHEGCPYRCAFCNQSKITGVHVQSDEIMVQNTIKSYLSVFKADNMPNKREVAFYGGSFTGLGIERQKQLLKSVQPWIKSEKIHSVRVSTHSLVVDQYNISFLKKNNVRTIELGIQSTNKAVLRAVGRPCEFRKVSSAVNIIRKNDMKIGMQLMPGLPLDDELNFIKSVKDVIELKPDFARIYPTLVIKGTPLFELYKSGSYVPWNLNRMINIVKDSLIEFQKADIPVIRIGLHADRSMLDNLVDGPYHPSFRYLVDRLIARDKMFKLLNGLGNCPKNIKFKVPSRQVSLFLGHKKDNIFAIKKVFGIENIFLIKNDNQKEIELVA